MGDKGIKPSKLAIGLDIGTMTLVCARNDVDIIKSTRNVFLPISHEDISVSELTDINYIQADDGSGDLYIIGDDAFKFGNIFGQKVSRPMENGLISPSEIAAVDVIALIIKNLIGDIKDHDAYCSYSIPAEAIDQSRSVTYHEKVFGRILSSIGINHTPVNEGMAVVYSECQEEKFSGVGISFGAGMVNVAVAFSGIEVLKFSTSRSGDWIDKCTAESLGLVQNRVTAIKEKKLNLEDGFINEPNKKTRRVLEALQYYYNSLIEYTIKKLINEFNNKVNIEIDETLPIVISGGTSLPIGFLNLFDQNLKSVELPFEVKEVRQATNPMTAVAKGLLVKTMADIGN